MPAFIKYDFVSGLVNVYDACHWGAPLFVCSVFGLFYPCERNPAGRDKPVPPAISGLGKFLMRYIGKT